MLAVAPSQQTVRRATLVVLLWTLALQGSTCSAPSWPGETWVIAGQSNAVGRSGWADAPVPSPLHALARTAWGEIRTAVDPLDGGPGNPWRSPWPHFAAARIAAGAPTPYLVQTAQGGTCLVYARQHGEPRWDPATGDLYQRMLERVADARARGFPPVAGVLWHQGECEANLPLDTYELLVYAWTNCSCPGSGFGVPPNEIRADVSLSLTAIPEPSTLVLLGLGLAGLSRAAPRRD